MEAKAHSDEHCAGVSKCWTTILAADISLSLSLLLLLADVGRRGLGGTILPRLPVARVHPRQVSPPGEEVSLSFSTVALLFLVCLPSPVMFFFLQFVCNGCFDGTENYFNPFSFLPFPTLQGEKDGAHLFTFVGIYCVGMRIFFAKVPWPLDVIFSEQLMELYNAVFQFLLQVKMAKWCLDEIRIGCEFYPGVDTAFGHCF